MLGGYKSRFSVTKKTSKNTPYFCTGGGQGILGSFMVFAKTSRNGMPTTPRIPPGVGPDPLGVARWGGGGSEPPVIKMGEDTPFTRHPDIAPWSPSRGRSRESDTRASKGPFKSGGGWRVKGGGSQQAVRSGSCKSSPG